jgi:hypothetical protein
MIRPVSANAEAEVNGADARLWHAWLRINCVLRVMLLPTDSAGDRSMFRRASNAQ